MTGDSTWILSSILFSQCRSEKRVPKESQEDTTNSFESVLSRCFHSAIGSPLIAVVLAWWNYAEIGKGRDVPRWRQLEIYTNIAQMISSSSFLSVSTSTRTANSNSLHKFHLYHCHCCEVAVIFRHACGWPVMSDVWRELLQQLSAELERQSAAFKEPDQEIVGAGWWWDQHLILKTPKG